MTYSVVLYKGDIGFTSDYSNVLRFDRPEERDNYFDNSVDGIPINNTDYINIGVFENSIKISFGDSFTGQFIENLDNFSYMRIDTELVKYGTPNYTPYRKYYFINGYSIINSSSNLTTVEFYITDDYWMNYQFHFDLKECNVERSHMDRWDINGDIKYKQPTLDSLESFNEVEEYHKVFEGFTHNDINCAWVLVSAIHSRPSPDLLLHHIFPIRISDLSNINDYCPSSENDKINFIKDSALECYGEYQGVGFTYYFPPLKGLNNYILNDCLKLSGQYNDDVVRVVNIQILPNDPFNLTFDVGYYYYLGNTQFTGEITGIEVKGLYNGKLKLNISNIGQSNNPNRIFVVSAVISDLSKISTYIDGEFVGERINLDIRHKPEKPIDGADYSDKYEPKLFLSPVRTHYIMSKDTASISTIPDILLTENKFNMTFLIRNSFSVLASYVYLKSRFSARHSDNAIGFSYIQPFYKYDYVNDTFEEYCVTQRDSDRQMMFVNMLTGSISDAGSTAISAGIGYRANEERAKLIDIQNKENKNIRSMTHGLGSTMGEASLSSKIKYSGEISNMYRKMASSAVGFSLLGGVTNMISSGVASYAKQMSKEKVIRNTPGNLMFSGEAMGAISNNEIGCVNVTLKVDSTSYERYKNIFMKFGYEIASVIKPNIKSRKYFNYIKTNGAILTGNINQGILAKLSTIFDNGVTIWHMDYCTRETLYNYDKENIERSLM